MYHQYTGCPKKRTFRIIILQAAASGRSGSRCLKYDLPEAAACRMMILKVRFLGTPCTSLIQFVLTLSKLVGEAIEKQMRQTSWDVMWVNCKNKTKFKQNPCCIAVLSYCSRVRQWSKCVVLQLKKNWRNVIWREKSFMHAFPASVKRLNPSPPK